MRNLGIREPKQQRSIEKKKRIIDAGFKLFCEKGYHNTNTAEIAQEAGVSTGIVYNYFENKKGIFLEFLNLYSKQISEHLYIKLKEIEHNEDISEYLSYIIDSFAESHFASKEAHEEIMAMSHSDKDVSEFIKDFKMNTILKLSKGLNDLGFNIENPLEKINIAYNLIEDYCHEIVYYNDTNIDYSVMKKHIIKIIANLLTL